MEFSILIAVYNKEKYLKECLDSVLNQTYQNFELVLVDDGSTDESGAICDQYAENSPGHSIIVIHTSNRGALMAKRETLKHARGNYFVFSDADDILELNLLQCLHEAIEQSNCDIYLYNSYQLKNNEKSIWSENIFEHKKIFDLHNKREFLDTMLDTIPLHSLCTKAVKKDIIDWECNYLDVSFLTNGDDLLQSLVWFEKANTIQYLDIPLYNYRYNENGISKKYNENYYKSFSAVYKVIFEYMEKWNLNHKEIKISNTFLEIIDQDIRLFIKDGYSSFSNLKEHLTYILDDEIYIKSSNIAEKKRLPTSKRLTIFLLNSKLFFLLYIYRKIKPE